ncbi:MAG: rod shape-determining protein MreC [Nitrospira sp.]
MNYPLRSKPKHENRFKTIVVISLFLFFSVLSYFFPNALRTTSHYFARSLWYVSDTVTKPFKSIGYFFTTKNALVERDLFLEDQLSDLKLKLADYDLVTSENQDLRNQLGRNSVDTRILSRVLSKPPRSPYDTLVIDVGSSQGVTLGNKVYLSGNVIVGLVTSVTPRTSLVRLFSAGDQKQESVLSRTGASFELQGKGGANFTVEVPKDTDVVVGDVLTYPGISTGVIGSVYSIDTNSQSSFKTVYLRIPINVFSAKWVYIEK